MKRRRPRQLRPEERALWDQVARSTDRLRPTAKPEKGPAPPTARPDPSPPPVAKDPIPAFRVGSKVSSKAPPASPRPDPTPAPLSMDAKAYGRLTRGKLQPEARIDLHGMTLAEAHGALTRFILNSKSQGRRLVLVITGKGRERDTLQRNGILRQQVPHWLRLAPLAAVVLQVAPAHQRHGGSGALYVYLRR